MSSVYTGVNNNNPASITIPSDGDDENAASVNVAFQALQDRVNYTQYNAKTEKRVAFNATAASGFTVPSDVTVLHLTGFGGGGSGGGGGTGGTATSQSATGGGGGGGATQFQRTIAVTPGAILDINIGAGGSVPSGGVDGVAGGDTTLVVHGGATLATFAGGQGGKAGVLRTGSFGMCAGGCTTKGGFQETSASFSEVYPLSFGASAGGDGVCNAGTPRAGFYSTCGFAGGNAGGTGASAGGGGAGGGGGGGPNGTGGAGGNGGAGGGGLTVGSPGSPTVSGANTGAGGGGGGGGGTTTGAGLAGGNGGAGGSGFLAITYTSAF